MAHARPATRRRLTEGSGTAAGGNGGGSVEAALDMNSSSSSSTAVPESQQAVPAATGGQAKPQCRSGTASWRRVATRSARPSLVWGNSCSHASLFRRHTVQCGFCDLRTQNREACRTTLTSARCFRLANDRDSDTDRTPIPLQASKELLLGNPKSGAFGFDPKLSFSSTTSSSVTFAVTAIKKAEKVEGTLKISHSAKKYSADATVDPAGKVAVSASLSDVAAPGLKLSGSATLPDPSSAKLGLDYVFPYMSLKTTVALTAAPSLDVAAATSYKGFLFGGETAYDSAKAAVTKYNVAVGYAAADFQVREQKGCAAGRGVTMPSWRPLPDRCLRFWWTREPPQSWRTRTRSIRPQPLVPRSLARWPAAKPRSRSATPRSSQAAPSQRSRSIVYLATNEQSSKRPYNATPPCQCRLTTAAQCLRFTRPSWHPVRRLRALSSCRPRTSPSPSSTASPLTWPSLRFEGPFFCFCHLEY